MPEDISGCHTALCYPQSVGRARDAAQWPAMHRTARSMGLSSHSVNSAEVDKLCPRYTQVCTQEYVFNKCFQGILVKRQYKEWIQIWPLETDTWNYMTLDKVFDLSMPRFTYL